MLSLIQRRLPLTTPLTCFTVTLSLLGMFLGLRRIRQTQFRKNGELAAFPSAKGSPSQPSSSESLRFPKLLTLWIDTLRGTVYMLHWLLVVGSTTARISIRPKRLKWVKTVHQGTLTPE